MIVMLLLTITGIRLNDKNRNPYKSNDYEISEIIKKNYIDEILDISDDGDVAFTLFQHKVNAQ